MQYIPAEQAGRSRQTVASAADPSAAVADLKMHPAYRPDIDGLRAVAVLSVLVYHAFPHALLGGFAGVDMFFVISGFLITGILQKSLGAGLFHLGDFYSRRIRRIFPVLVLVLFCTLLAGGAFLLPADFVRLGEQGLGGSAFVSNFVLWSNVNYFDAAAESKPLLHLWSLGIEEQFYVVWPLLLWAIWKLRWNTNAVLAIVAVASLGYCAYLTSNDITAAFYSPLSRFWELAAGGLLSVGAREPHGRTARALLRLDAAIVRRLPRRMIEREPAQFLKNMASLGGALLVVLTLVITRPDSDFPSPGALLPVLGAVLLLAAGPRTWINRRILSLRPMVWVGLISYPLYLWHWPIFTFLRIVNTNATPVEMRNAIWGAIAVSILAAWLSYRCLEQPLRKRGSANWKVFGLSATMVAVGAISLTIIQTGGLPSRMPKQMRAEATEDLRTDEWKAGLRNWVCHNMIYRDPVALGQPVCFETVHPRVMLWGDSHAAALYPGLRALQATRSFGVVQLTTDATPPFFDDSHVNNMQRSWKSVSDAVLKRVQDDPPEIVLLHAIWAGYGDGEFDVQALAETIPRIRAIAPKARIVVLGPVPRWSISLQQTLLNYTRSKGLDTAPDLHYMKYGLRDGEEEIDRIMAAKVPALGATYISAWDTLCNAEGCLVRLDSGELSAVDDAHLSAPAATFLASRIANRLLGPEIAPHAAK